MVALVLWLAVSLAFRLYLEYFNSYAKTYGSLGAVIILMLWFYLTGAAILIGAEVNSEIENAAAELWAPGESLRDARRGDSGDGARRSPANRS